MKYVWILLLTLILSTTGLATDLYRQQSQAIGADKLERQLPAHSQELLEGIAPENDTPIWDKFTLILRRSWNKTKESVFSALKSGGKMLAAILVCAAAATFTQGKNNRSIVWAGAAIICGICFADYKSCLREGLDAVSQLSAYSKLLLPVMAGAAAASGGITAASGLYALATFFFQLLISAVETVVIPLIGVLLAVSLTKCVSGSDGLSRFSALLQSAIKNFLRILTFLFSAFLSLTGVVSGKADAMAMKATKLAAGTVVPVVGGMISDASETILVSAGILRDSVGVFGMLAVLSILILPFLKISVQYVVLQAFTLLSSFVGLKEHTALLSAITSAMGLLAGVTCCCGVFAFIACVCFMKAGIT